MTVIVFFNIYSVLRKFILFFSAVYIQNPPSCLSPPFKFLQNMFCLTLFQLWRIKFFLFNLILYFWIHISGKLCCLSSLGHSYLGKLSSPFSSDTRYSLVMICYTRSIIWHLAFFIIPFLLTIKTAYQRSETLQTAISLYHTLWIIKICRHTWNMKDNTVDDLVSF
jgi:hypothetical protein